MAQVADLHARVFWEGKSGPTEGLRRYYAKVFLENPWLQEDMPSLVCENLQGAIVGFMGRICRRMLFHGRPIRVAIAHRLMVAPEQRNPLIGARMVKTFFSGPQDLCLSDGVSPDGKRIWEAAGGIAVPAYSMNWIRPLRPAGLLCKALACECGMNGLSRATQPLARAIDVVLDCMRWTPFRQVAPATLEEPMTPERLLECTAVFARTRALRPELDAGSLAWLLERLEENRHRGELRGFIVRTEGGQMLGGCLYYLRRQDLSEVMLLAVDGRSAGQVLRHLFHRAWREGAVGLQGRFDPAHLAGLMDQRCLCKRGNWMMVHSRDRDVLCAIQRGDAFLTCLEGELWLRSPENRI